MKNVLIASLLALGAAASFAQAPAATQFDQTHPRRAEVNQRLAKQDRRIQREVKEGEMTKARAARLHREDRRIRKEERMMASQNGGHVTKQEQRTLNQQENKVSAQIGK
jgi:CRISPR/Cas system-associated endoribonuclease Cas2